MFAAQYGHKAVMEFLISNGASMFSCDKVSSSQSPNFVHNIM